MRILGLDCGLKTGWCIFEKGKVVESGVEDFKPRRGSSNGMLFLEYRRWLSMIMLPKPGQETKKKAFDLIVYEQSHMRGAAPTELQVNMTGRVQEIAAGMKIDFVPVHTATLKKSATDKGKASKEDMKKAASRILGRVCESDDEADAVLLAQYGWDEYACTDPAE